MSNLLIQLTLLVLLLLDVLASDTNNYYQSTNHNINTNTFRQSFGKNLQENQYLSTGTTIVGVCCKDGIVLGADTRSTGGPIVMDKNKLKIHFISRNIYCCAAGTAADCDFITRKVSHELMLYRIDKELAIDSNLIDSVRSAVNGIVKSIVYPDGRKPQSVFVVGGVDVSGPSLFTIDMNGVPQQVSFTSLGSGSTDALAVLESDKYKWDSNYRNRTIEDKDNSSTSYDESYSCNDYQELVSVAEALPTVRKAVQAGILNDLGSGSHVDLCVITAQGVEQWREELISTWDKDRITIPESIDMSLKTENNEDNEATQGKDSNVYKDSKAFRSTRLGKVVYSRKKLRKVLKGGKAVEVFEVDNTDSAKDLYFNIEEL